MQWDIFCRVIDNYGDIGVCWRLAADLAARGQRVRLWTDDARALAWMAPAGAENIEVFEWLRPLSVAALARSAESPGDVMVEAFGCEIAIEFIAQSAGIARARGRNPVWINLEYLTAEGFAERSHGLPSLVSQGPAAGWTKLFFYPGFTGRTGGLLREPGLAARQAALSRQGWFERQGIAGPHNNQTLISLFCYEPPALAAMLRQLEASGLDGRPAHLLVTAGRATHAVKQVSEAVQSSASTARGMLSISYLPKLTQTGYDELLWSCDLNFVRGEDSLVRAIWAGKPLVWQLYPQQDGVHQTKLEAFLSMLQAPASLQEFHRSWNSGNTGANRSAGNLPDPDELIEWRQTSEAARAVLLAQDDLGTRLLNFVEKAVKIKSFAEFDGPEAPADFCDPPQDMSGR